METYLSLRPFVVACRYGSEYELREYAEKQGPMLVSEVVSSAWLTNTNKEIFYWIAKHVKNSGKSMSSESIVWATIIQLCQYKEPTENQQEQIAYFLKSTNLSHDILWQTICYPRLPCIESLQHFIKLCKPSLQGWMWIWQAAWNAGATTTAQWVLQKCNIKLSSLPTNLRTICIFRKPIDYELVETVPLSALKCLIDTIMSDSHIKTICIEICGGYRELTLEWELPGRLSRTTRNHDTKSMEQLVPLRFHEELKQFYETPTASFKLLWLGLAPSYLEHLEKILEILDSSRAILVNVTGYCNEKSSEDKNILLRTLRHYAETHLCASHYRTNMFIDACI